ncbi:MAG: hypothetical protein JWO51_105 [Rhodospirillales bacterium]|nr:hypothetical protein [Rhodospirillales bacterium]
MAAESWLRHGATNEQFAAAMMKCRNSSGACSYAGRCMLGGCFTRQTANRDILGRIDRLEKELADLKSL